MKKTKLIPLLAAILFSVSVARASVIYSYTGNPFNGFAGTYGASFTEIGIALTFDQPLPPSSQYSYESGVGSETLLNWHVSDGLFDLGPSYLGSLVNCDLATDASGQIYMWDVVVQATDSNGVQVSDQSSPFFDLVVMTGTLDGEDDSVAFVYGLPGTWSQEGQVPEPGSFAPVLGALAVGAGYGIRQARRQRAQRTPPGR
jgi:hypothetical protein